MFEPTSTFEAPSTNQLTALRRAPAIDTLTVLVRPMPTSSESELDDPRHQGRELDEVAVVEGQLLHLGRPHEALDRGRGLDELGRRRHLHGLLLAFDPERHVQGQPVVHVKADASGHEGLEARRG